MDKKIKYKVKGTLVVLVGLVLAFIPFSMFIGWNLVTLILFWFGLVPGLAIYLPKSVNRNKHLFESLGGLTVLYGIMVVMIYDHYKTDYFQIMILSAVINITLVLSMTWIRKNETSTRHPAI